jgi:hypothetical protein
VFSRRRLLAAADLKGKCVTAARARTTCAKVCLGAFLAMVVIVLGFRAVPFTWVPVLMGAAFAVFFVSTLLAYRFGRLCDAQVGPSRRNAIIWLCQTSPDADAYYRKVIGQGRPFTRLDLDEMRSM